MLTSEIRSARQHRRPATDGLMYNSTVPKTSMTIFDASGFTDVLGNRPSKESRAE